ncbi:MAG: metallophosphoesterase [Vampirovibrionales bacterium]|nr:metallophosphoesterase [Vampirovibrionales bacterium]
MGTFGAYSAAKKTVTSAPPPVASFIAFGDSGSGLSPQRQLAAQMLAQYVRAPFTTALVLGDIIYETGDIRKYGAARYRDVYAPLMDKGVQFRPVLGNHDVLLGFKPAMLTFYGMPGRYYQFRQGPVAFFAIDTNITHDALQRQWLDKALAASDAPWKVVYGHHPLYSSGEHGASADLQRWLQPVFRQHGVALYLCGHDHDYERMGPIEGVTYIVSGGGGASLRKFSNRLAPQSQARARAYHFLRGEATPQALSVSAIGLDGQVLDAFTLRAAPVALPKPTHKPAAPKKAVGSGAK